MKKEIIKRLSEKNVWLKKLAKELNISYFQLLKSCPETVVKSYPTNKIDELFKLFRSWDKITFVVQNCGFTAEIKDFFPQGEYGENCYNLHDERSAISGHLKVEEIAYIFLVKDFAYKRVSYSAKFFTKNGTAIFSVYLPRDKQKKLIDSSLNQFLDIANFNQ